MSFGQIVGLFQAPGPSKIVMNAAPVVDATGVAYVALGESLTALDVTHPDLAIIWSVGLGGAVPGTVAIGSDGLIRVHAQEGLWAFDRDGLPAWGPIPVGPPLGNAGPVIGPDGATYVSFQAGGLLRVEPNGGFDPEPYWLSTTRFDAPAVIADGVLYTGGEDHYLHAIALDGVRGRPVWATEQSQGRTNWAIQSRVARARSSKSDLWIVAGRDGLLIAFDSEGRRAWQGQFDGPMLGSAVVTTDGGVVFGLSRSARGRDPWGELVCVSADSGEVRWSYPADGPIESTPVIGDDGVVYFGDNAEILHAVGLDGTPIESVHHGATIRSTLAILAPHRLAFGQADGSLAVVECPSQRAVTP